MSARRKRFARRRPVRTGRGAGALALLLSLVVPRLVHGQAPATPSPSPPPERLVVALEQRTRVEGFTHPFRLGEAGPTRVVALRTRLQVTLPRIAGPLGALVELQDSRSGWNEKPFVVPARHVNHLDFLQAHVRLGFDGLLGDRVSAGALLGRFTLDLGRRRFAARNGMRNTTNAFDGALGWVRMRDGSGLRVLFSRPVRIEPEGLDRSTGSRLFWGGVLTLARWRALQVEAWGLRLDESDETETRRQYTTLGARLFRLPAPGTVDYEVEAAWQRGTRDALDREASFAHLEAGFSFRGVRARVAALYDHASGNRDPGDDVFGRFDTLFGARRFEYAPTGIYGPFFRSNIEGPGLRLTMVPARPVEVMVAHRVLWLAEARDAWVGSGLWDASGESGRFLGHHLEARVRWRPKRWLILEANWAHFFKGSYLQQIPTSPRTPDSDYVTVGFAVGDTVFAR